MALMDRVALEQGLRLAQQPNVTRFDAAVVRKGTDGKVSSHEVPDVTAERGAMVGAIAGGVLTLLAALLGLAAGGSVQGGGQAAAETSGGTPCRSCVSEA
jgi:uncharacterized membrane protein